MEEGREYLTTEQAAKRMGVSRPTFIKNVLDAGKLPYHKVGRHRRVLAADFEAYWNQTHAGPLGIIPAPPTSLEEFQTLDRRLASSDERYWREIGLAAAAWLRVFHAREEIRALASKGETRKAGLCLGTTGTIQILEDEIPPGPESCQRAFADPEPETKTEA